MFYSKFPLAGTFVQRIINEELHKFYARKIVQLLKLSKEFTTRFPGSNPVSMMRSDMIEIRNSPSLHWLVTEKSDGTRFFLVLTISPQNDPIALLVDRSYGIYIVPGLVFSSHLYVLGTIFDTELVSELPREEEVRLLGTRPTLWLLLTFDLLACAGDCLCNRPFHQRLAILDSILNNNYKPQLGVDLAILKRKAFFALAELSELFGTTFAELRHGSDGLIIQQANILYKPGMQNTILKWKQKEKHTIDYLCHMTKVVEPNHKWLVGIYVHDTTFTPVLANHILITSNGLAQLGLKDILELELCILECYYSAKHGWRPLKLRHDKADPNTEYTLRKTWQNIQEDIRIEELFELTRAPLPDQALQKIDDLAAILED